MTNLSDEVGFPLPERFDVLGVGVSVLNMASCIDCITQAGLRPKLTGYITVTGVHGVMESQCDSLLMQIHNESFLTTPDGMPLVWLGKRAGYKSCMGRVYGPELMENVMLHGAEKGFRHLLFGGKEGVATDVCTKFQTMDSRINIIAAPAPPFRPLLCSEELELLELIQCYQPHFLWVGLSTPKQERFMAGFIAKYGARLQNRDHGLLMIGVGAAFDFHAGRLKQAPRWMQMHGLEWFYRLIKEPRRLWRRYLIGNPRFVWLLLRQLVSGKLGRAG